VILDFSYEYVAEAIHMPNEGKKIKRESKLNMLEEIFKFKYQGVDFMKLGSCFECKSLSKHWEKVVRALKMHLFL